MNLAEDMLKLTPQKREKIQAQLTAQIETLEAMQQRPRRILPKGLNNDGVGKILEIRQQVAKRELRLAREKLHYASMSNDELERAIETGGTYTPPAPVVLRQGRYKPEPKQRVEFRKQKPTETESESQMIERYQQRVDEIESSGSSRGVQKGSWEHDRMAAVLRQYYDDNNPAR